MEQHLPGGLVNAVVRVGDTVRRPPPPGAAFVHALLGHLNIAAGRGRPGSSAPTPRAARSCPSSTGTWPPPGERFHDLADVCWQFLDLGPSVTDLPATARRTRMLDTILWWQDRCWRGIEARALAGDPAMTRLRAQGAPTAVRAAHAWVATHRPRLEAALA